jgi:hypothetical protein
MATSAAQAVLRAYCETHDEIFAFADTLTHDSYHFGIMRSLHSLQTVPADGG